MFHPDTELIEVLAVGDLVTQVDESRSDYDSFKLSAQLRGVLTSRLNTARAANAGLLLAQEDGPGAGHYVPETWKRLSELLRDGYQHLRAVPEEDAPAQDVVQALETYGWERGLFADVESPPRIEILVRAALHATPDLPPNLRYPAGVLIEMTTWMGVLEAAKVLGAGGTIGALKEDRNEKLDSLRKAIERVRHHYCTASDDGESNPELARVGLPLKTTDRPTTFCPGRPGAADFETGKRQWTLPTLPRGAQALAAWRRPKGGDLELAGVSVTPTVGVSNFSPLRCGFEYELWVTGRNAAGDGPESNRLEYKLDP